MFDPDEIEDIREHRDRWESETLGPALDQHSERNDRFAAVSNHEVDRLYAPEDVADLDFEDDLGSPENRRTHGSRT